MKAEHRKSGNAFVVDVNYFRKKPLKGGVPYVFVKKTTSEVYFSFHESLTYVRS